MAFQQVMFAAQTVDLLTPAEQTQTVDLLTGEEENKTVDLLTPAEPSAPIEQPIEQSEPIIEKNKETENQTVDLLTPGDDEVVPEEGKKSTTTILIGGEEEEETQDDSWDLTPAEITVPEENHDEEEKKDATFEDEEHHENAGVLPWSTDLVKPWSIYREPKKVYRPGEDLDLTELLVEIKTGRSGSLYNIEDLINDEFTTITRTRKSDGEKVRLDDKIYEDETMTIHMDGCQDLTIDFTVDENLKDEEEALEAFQDNLIREEFRDGLDFSLYLIKKGERENPIVAYSLDPHKLTPIGNGVDKKLKDGPLFDLKDINTWDRFDIETLGKVKAILERSAEIKNIENVRKKLITQLAIWNVTSNIIPREIDATVSEIEENETTELGPELKPTDEEEVPEEKEEEPIEIIDPTTPEEEIESDKQDDEIEAVEEKTEAEEKTETEEPAEEKTEVEESVEENTQENKESEKIEEQAPVQSTVHKIVFDVREIDLPYNEVELSDEEYALYNELTSLEAIELKSEDEDLKIYEPIIEETENPYADLVTIGESDIDSIERVETEVTFDAVDYSFQNLYHTLETSSMLGFGQPRDFNVLLKATMKASRKIVEGDKFEVEILSKTLPILNGEEGRANDIQIDGKVVATAEYIAEEHKIVYTFVEDLDTDKVEIEQEFKQIKEEKAALLNMLDVSENLVLDAVRGAEGDEDSEENPDELEISPEFEENLIQLKLGNTPVQYNGVSFETKKFRLKTKMTAKAFPVWQIPKGWTFDVNIGPYLKPEYDKNSKPILAPLYDPDNPDNPNEAIAEPSYNEATHTITYTYVKSLSSTKTLDIDQYLAFDTDNIDDKEKIDINISVEPKNNPKQQMPTKTVYRDDRSPVITSAFEVEFDQNGEPNLNDGYKFFEYGPSYKVTFNASANPIIENREVKFVEWTVVFDGNGEKLNSKQLDLITNFTAVRNSGLEKLEIEDVTLNGQGIKLNDNDIGDKFLINDSKHFDGRDNSDSVYTFKFKTKVDSKQKAYVLDIAAKLRGVKKTGAVRLIMPAYEGARLEMVSPNDMTHSNRTTISGKFTSENTAEWIVTEEVSTGDQGSLPLIERNISENQTLNSLNVAYYGLNSDGKMAQFKGKTPRKGNSIAAGNLDGEKIFAPGTIAVYEYKTSLLNSDKPETYTLSNGAISKYRDVDVNITWSKRVENSKYPEETLILSEKDNEVNSASIKINKENDPPQSTSVVITKVPNVKIWNIDQNGEPKKIEYKIKQEIPQEGKSENGKKVKYGEVYKRYEPVTGIYEIQNYIVEDKGSESANITIMKTDEGGKALSGAKFKLFGIQNTEEQNKSEAFTIEGISGQDGLVEFNNIPSGIYTLKEERAPEGYTPLSKNETITVNDDGSVEWTNNIITEASFKKGSAATGWKSDTKYYNGSFAWPGYMNTLNYTEVDKNNNFTSYIMLKPDVNSFRPNGTEFSYTDRCTRVSMFGDNLSITNAQIFDVHPNEREQVKNAMYGRTADKLSLGDDLSNDGNNNGAIVNNANYNDKFLGKNVHAIMLPYKRFGEPDPKEPIENFKGWAFLIKVTGTIADSAKDSTFSYRWLTTSKTNVNDIGALLPPKDIEGETKIESDTIIPVAENRNSAKNPTFTVVNESAKLTKLNIQKQDDKGNQLSEAEFRLYNSDNELINSGVTTSTGKLTFEGLAPGEYTLKETKSPAGYHNPELTFKLLVSQDGSILYSATDKKGNTVPEGDYYIVGDSSSTDPSIPTGETEITVQKAIMYLDEKDHYGKTPGVWEEAAYESYSFEGNFHIENAKAGESWVMDFDDNWNFTQWSGKLPEITSDTEEVIAKGEIDYTNNQIKYTLEDNKYVKDHSTLDCGIKLNSIRPSKYYVKNNGIYTFRDVINVGANQKVVDTTVNADLFQFYGERGGNQYITQNVDIYKDKNEDRYFMRNIALFNAKGVKNFNGKNIARIYYGSSINNGKEILFGDKQEPTFKPVKVIIYKVEHPNSNNMPLSCGIRPSVEPGYTKIAEYNDFSTEFVQTKGNIPDRVTMNFNPKRVDINDNYRPTIYSNDKVQFIITLPDKISGYVIEQFYEITDVKRFENTYTQTFMFHDGGSKTGGWEQIKPTLNSGAGIGGDYIPPKPKNYDLTVFNKKQPGEFIVKKVSEKDSEGNVKELAGAEFTLYDKNNKVVRRNSSNTKGIVEFKGLSEGTYTLKETVAPEGYKATDRTIKVIVDDKGNVKFEGINLEGDDVFDSKTSEGLSKKVRRTIRQEYETSQPLRTHAGYPAFMNIASKVISKSDDVVKTRIYLNPKIDSTEGKGPNKKTVLKLEDLNAESISTTVYEVPEAYKGDIDGYLKGYNNNATRANKQSEKVIEFSADKNSRWSGDAYVIDVEAKYDKPVSDLGKTVIQDRIISYEWYCDPDVNTRMEGKVGTRAIANTVPVDSSATGSDIFEIAENGLALLEVTNKPDKAKVTITKVDEKVNEDGSYKLLPGAIFGLFDENDKAITKDGENYEVETDKEGKATFKDLEPGTYIIKEIKAPNGYEKTNKTWTVVVKEDNTVEVTENSTVSKTVFGIDNPNTNLIGTWNFTYYQKHVLDVSPVIEQSGDGYVVNVTTKGTSYSKDNRYSQLNMYFDTEHFEFEDTSIKQYDWFGKYVYFNSAPNTYSFKFKPKANVKRGSYKPITGITYVNFPMSHEFLPTFNVKMEDGQKESKPVGFNSDGNEFSYNISNKYKGYEVEFEKICEENGKEIKLTGAKFKLQMKDGENYVDFNPAYTEISDAEGKIKFSGLKPGEYKVVETDPPAGYYVLNKDVKLFKIDDDGNVFIKENGEYKPYTKDNAKILNSKPGDGKFKIHKTDENGKGLQGVKFNLYNSRGDLVGEFTTDKNGEINFTNLPYDKYYVKEFSTKPGYILDNEVRVVMIGKKWEKGTPTGRDVSNKLILNKESKMTSIINDDLYITPNNSEVIQANLKLKVDEDAKIQPGDSFTVYASDNVDLDGIGRSHDDEYDIYGPAGLLATAEINKNRREITYTFTEYAKHYDIKNINIGMLIAVNRIKVLGDEKGIANIVVGVKVGKKDETPEDKIIFDYSEKFAVKYNYGDDVQVNACLVKFIEGSNDFVANFYLNHKHINTYGKKIYFTSNSKVEFKDVQVKYLKNIASYLPWSFGIKDSEPDLSDMGSEYYTINKTNDGMILSLNGNYFDNMTYRVIVKGKVTSPSEDRFALYAEYINYNESNQRYYQMVGLYKSLKNTKSYGDGVIVLPFTNRKNKIEYTKVDGTISGTADDNKQQGASQGSNEPIETPKPVFASEGKALEKAEFKLKKDGVFDDESLRVSGEDGKFSWEGLAPGYYEVWETKAPDGYPTPKEKVSHFTVNENGKIVDIKNNTTIIKNYKKPNIEFNKIDGRDKTPLKDAEFTLYKAKVENGSPVKDGDSLKFEVVNIEVEESSKKDVKEYTAISDENGFFKFEKLEDGIYAVKETKEPDGYIRFKNYVFYFKVEGTKIYRVNKLGDYIDKSKEKEEVVKDENKDADSLIVDMEKDTAQVNPIQIENFKAEYPSTGGVGALPFVFIGMMIMMVGAYMFIRRRDALYE